MDDRLRRIQNEATSFDILGADEGADSRSRYFSYRSLEDLPPAGRAFYEAVAKSAGLSSSSLLKAVNMLELEVRSWQRRQRKQAGGRERIPGH